MVSLDWDGGGGGEAVTELRRWADRPDVGPAASATARLVAAASAGEPRGPLAATSIGGGEVGGGGGLPPWAHPGAGNGGAGWDVGWSGQEMDSGGEFGWVPCD